MSTQSGKYRNEPESCSGISISSNNNQKMKQLQEDDEKQRENKSTA